VAIVVPMRNELPTLEGLLTQEAALPMAPVTAAAPPARDVPIEGVDTRADHTPVPLLLATVSQAEAPP
jgi:hypothetical protein